MEPIILDNTIGFLKFLSTLDIFIYIANFLILTTVLRVLIMIFRLSKNKILGHNTKPLSQAGTGGKRILIIGDSTAVGTGADKVEDSIGGRLAYDFPDSEIINAAVNGSLIRDLHKQIAPYENDKFDLIIISSGGNDVWHFTRLTKIREHLMVVLPKLVNMCTERMFFLVYSNAGSAPLFPRILRGILTRRCNRVQDVIREVSYITNVPTIEIFSENKDNPFIEHPDDLFAADGIHPSSNGYRLWYYRMWRKITRSV